MVERSESILYGFAISWSAAKWIELRDQVYKSSECLPTHHCPDCPHQQLSTFLRNCIFYGPHVSFHHRPFLTAVCGESFPEMERSKAVHGLDCNNNNKIKC